MSKKWVKEKRRDHYYRQAKEKGYRSRASFKLKELNKRFDIIKEGDAVLDLGAAPGGWMQVAREIAGENGLVVGVDLVGIEPFSEENVHFIRGDLRKKETLERIRKVSPEFDAIISDASPDISGVWDIDHASSIDLARHTLDLGKELLKEGGNLLVKVFQGSMIGQFKGYVKKEFEYVKTTKPRASRARSAEVYIVGRGLLKTPVRYGEVFELDIEAVGKKGDGLGFVDGFAVAVPQTRPGERVRVRIKSVSRNIARAVRL